MVRADAARLPRRPSPTSAVGPEGRVSAVDGRPGVRSLPHPYEEAKSGRVQ